MNAFRLHVAMAFAAALTMTCLPKAAVADEAGELRTEVQALQQRLDKLESGKSSEVPAWVSNFTWKGDLRFRFESIDQQYSSKRNRYRIRARAGFQAKVNDTIRSEFALATAENGDPRSTNQTLTGENTHKSITLDLAYAEWAPGKDWKLSAGKMRFPLVRPGLSTFIDGDINPEGVAVNWSHGQFSAAVLYNLLEERSAARESSLLAGQLAWQSKVGAGSLKLGTSLYAFSGVQGFNPFYNSSANGNTTTSVALECKGVATCLVNDYDIVQLLADWSQPVAGRPLSLSVDLDRNIAADNNLDTALSFGVNWGKAKDPGTWEVGYTWQSMEKDALYGQYVDSDFGAGNTDSQGSLIRAAYAPAKNWVINATYFVNDTNVDVPTTVTGVGSVQKRGYNRLQLDLSFKF